jgi:hypothetical protein
VRRPKLAAIIAPVLVAFGAAATLAACRKPNPQAPAPQAAPGDTAAERPAQAAMRARSPLAGLAGQHIAVLPVHYVRADTIGVAARIDDPRGLLVALDSAIERSLGERGFRTSWTFPPALARSAKRNAGYLTDPYSLAAERLRAGVRMSDDRLAEPLASQLRSIVAVTDARYALFPVELRFERVPDGRIRPVLHVVLLDARASSVRWVGDVRGAATATLTPATLESVAFALADLVAAP